MQVQRPLIVEPDDAAIARAAALLADGKLVGMPTETVYGLACHAFNAAAAAAVFASKGRPSFDPLIVHVASAGDAWQLLGHTGHSTDEINGIGVAERLAEAFWPGALTMVLPKPAAVPGIVTAGLETVGVRVPSHSVARDLIAALAEQPTVKDRGLPGSIAAPSANVFGGVSPSRAEHVTVDCAMVLDGGPCETGVESTVVRAMDDGTVAVLRLGGVSVEALSEVVGERQVRVIAGQMNDDEAGKGLASPGTTLKHYAPQTPLRLVPDRAALASALEAANGRGGVIGIRLDGVRAEAVEDLSPTGDMTEAAANLFAAMHRLDAAGLDLIVAEAVPEIGLGRAINDRLRRASR
ncbi:MAG: L-threonylcarbamoyladenylate synthase [Planctomycetota bacterium]